MAQRPHSHETIPEFLRALWKLDHDLQRVSKHMEATLGLTARGRAVNRSRIGTSEFAVRRSLARVPVRDIAIAQRPLATTDGRAPRRARQ